MKNQKSLLILLLCLLFAACSKKSEYVNSQDTSDSQFYAEIASVRNEINQKNKISQEENAETTEPSDEEVEISQENQIQETDNVEIENNLQKESLEENSSNSSQTEKLDYDPNFDDTKYDDDITTEFSLHKENGVEFILYHNLRNIEEIDWKTHEVFKDWSTSTRVSKWCKQEFSGIDLLWNYRNGAILKIVSESPEWITRHGIKVGDPIQKVSDFYGKFSDIFVYNEKENMYEKTVDNEYQEFSLLVSDEFQSLNAGNMVAEEMMTMVFHQKDGIICKIEIYCHS